MKNLIYLLLACTFSGSAFADNIHCSAKHGNEAYTILVSGKKATVSRYNPNNDMAPVLVASYDIVKQVTGLQVSYGTVQVGFGLHFFTNNVENLDVVLNKTTTRDEITLDPDADGLKCQYL
jgi:hypothetical protein